MATFSDLFTRLDPDRRVRGKQFERICRWLLPVTTDATKNAVSARDNTLLEVGVEVLKRQLAETRLA